MFATSIFPFLLLISVAFGQLDDNFTRSGISCWAYQDENGAEPSTITCPGSDIVCVRYRAVDNGNLLTSTCVTSSTCQSMYIHPLVYSNVYCCGEDNCNHPSNGGALAVNIAIVLALLGILIL